MKQVYPTFIAENDGVFLVYVPGLEIYTEGESMADAIYMARDAIGLKGIVIEDYGKNIPMPLRAKEAIAKAKEDTEIFDFSTGLLTFVDVDFTEYRKRVDNKTVRRNVTLPNWLNIEADRANINVSGVLQKALKEALGVAEAR